MGLLLRKFGGPFLVEKIPSEYKSCRILDNRWLTLVKDSEMPRWSRCSRLTKPASGCSCPRLRRICAAHRRRAKTPRASPLHSDLFEPLLSRCFNAGGESTFKIRRQELHQNRRHMRAISLIEAMKL
jgi:hypothetical protein